MSSQLIDPPNLILVLFLHLLDPTTVETADLWLSHCSSRVRRQLQKAGALRERLVRALAHHQRFLCQRDLNFW